MAKSENDNMMTRPQLRGCSDRACVLSWSGERSPQWDPGAKPRLGVVTARHRHGEILAIVLGGECRSASAALLIRG